MYRYMSNLKLQNKPEEGRGRERGCEEEREGGRKGEMVRGRKGERERRYGISCIVKQRHASVAH
jgi:hypothetical protein